MNDQERNMFYQMFRQADEERQRNNFNAFMYGLESGCVKDLNEAWASGDIEKYTTLVHNIKTNLGVKVLRNSKGEHKLGM